MTSTNSTKNIFDKSQKRHKHKHKSNHKHKNKQKHSSRHKNKESKKPKGSSKPVKRNFSTLRHSYSTSLIKKFESPKETNDVERDVDLMLKQLSKNTEEARKKRQQMSQRSANPFELIRKGNVEALAQCFENLYTEIEQREEEIMTVAMAGLRVSKENKSIKKEIAKYEEQFEELYSTNQILEEKVKDSETDIRDLSKKNTFLREKVEEAWELNEKYLEQLKASDLKREKLIEKFNKEGKLESENLQLKEEIQTKKQIISEIHLQEEVNQQQKEEISNLQFRGEKLRSNNKILRMEYENIQTKYITQRKKMAKYEEKIQNIEQLENEIEQMQIQNYWLEKMILQKPDMVESVKEVVNWFILHQNENNNSQNLIFSDTNKALNDLNIILNDLSNSSKSNKNENENEYENENGNEKDNNFFLELIQKGFKANKENINEIEDSEGIRRILYLTVILFFQLTTSKFFKIEETLNKELTEYKETVNEYERKLERESQQKNNLEKILEKRTQDLESESKNKENLIERINKGYSIELNIAQKREKQLKREIEEIKNKFLDKYNNELTEKENKFKEVITQHQKREIKFRRELVELELTKNYELKKQDTQFESKMEEIQRKMENNQKKYEREKKEILAESQVIITKLKNKKRQIKAILEKTENNQNQNANTLNKKIRELENKIEKLIIEKEIRKNFEKDQVQTLQKKNEDLQLRLEIEQKKKVRTEKQKNHLEKQLTLTKKKISITNHDKEVLKDSNDKKNLIIKQLEQEIDNLRKQLEETIYAEMDLEVGAQEEEEEEGKVTESNREIDIVEQMMTEYINKELKYDLELKHLLPIGKATPDLIDAMRDGVLMCKLINHCVPNTIDERVINFFHGEVEIEKDMEEILENHTLCINSALAIGCNIKGVTADNLVNGEELHCLQLCWEIIKCGLLSKINLQSHPEIIILSKNAKKPIDLLSSSPEDLLLKWVNYHLQRNTKRGKKLTCGNFGQDLKGGLIIITLLNQLSPEKCPIEPFFEFQNIDSKLNYLLKMASNLDVHYFLNIQALLNGEKKLNLAFLAYLFNTRSGIEMKTQSNNSSGNQKRKLKNVTNLPFSNYGTREERSFRLWINSLGVKPKVNNLYEDLKDGSILLQVIEKISEKKFVNWKKVTLNCKNPFQKVGNCNYVVELGKQLNLKLLTTGGRDIYDGNKTMVLGYVWQLMRYHVMQILKKLNVISGSKIDDSAMVNWANNKVKNSGKHSKIRNFRDTKLKNSIFLLDLIYSINMKAVNYQFVSNGSEVENQIENAKLVISLTRKLGGRVFLLPEDIVEVKDKMILTLIGELMRIDKISNL
ncbi:fimbrin-1 [Anaeramoeba flamelloides]|uniref:Fimbrin-1 n=1 Tax=Anaeramoeba flamelloides TaxID=1746091 RepID=A0AAV7Z7Q4_9EUKA|nr:fimbrin-1 [Anaeramoeba flamelloides]